MLNNSYTKTINTDPCVSLLEKGYDLSYKLCIEDLNILKTFIKDQWIYRLQVEDAKLLAYIHENDIDLEDYHLISNKLKNKNIWSKVSRILPPSFEPWFSNTSFYKKLEQDFGEFSVSDEEHFGWPNFYWRIVRPNQTSDIGPLHRDSWFWKLNKSFKRPPYNFKRIKVWIAIITEPGLNGLLLEEYSHKRKDIKWSGELRDNIQKPVLHTNLSDLNPQLINRSPGEVIVFHDDLLHGGALNKGSKSRISMEFTMLVKI